MKDKILVWLGRHWKEIAYTIAGINLLSALNHLIQGNYALSALFVVIAGMVLLDTREF
jgi:hypothetical protein